MRRLLSHVLLVFLLFLFLFFLPSCIKEPPVPTEEELCSYVSSVKATYDEEGLPLYTYGSAVLFKEEGELLYYITNFHVIASEKEGKAVLSSSIYLEEKEATLLCFDASADLALLTIKKQKETSLPLLNCTDLSPNEKVSVIGNSENKGVSLFPSTILDTHAEISLSKIPGQPPLSFTETEIETDGKIGISGGGVFNSQGELIAIVHAYTSSEHQKIAYALPLSSVLRKIEYMSKIKNAA